MTKYERGFNTWRKWASQFKEIVIFPVSSVYVSLFILSLIQESVSCSIIDEVPLAFQNKNMVFIAFGLEVPLLLLMPESLINCLKDTAVGNQTRPKMATLRIIFHLCCMFLCHWVFNFPYFPFF